MPLKLKLVLVLFLTTASTAEASFLSVYLGPKSETYTEEGQTQRSRVNPASLLLEWGVKVRTSWYFSVGATGEVSFDDFTSRGFGVNFSVKRYFFGNPSLIEQSGIGSKISLVEPYGFFVGAGFFHKNVRFSSQELGDLDLNLGGPLVVFGGHYNISRRCFINSQIQVSISGIGSDESYRSFDFYGGIGLRL